jgi:hypothetical protein
MTFRKFRAAALAICWLVVAVPWAGLVHGQSATNLISETNHLDFDLAALTNEFKLQLWNTTLNLRESAGYKDNVEMSVTNRQGSAFEDAGADLTSIRLPTQGWLFSMFASGDDRRYFGGDSEQNEQVVLAAAQASRALPQSLSAGAGLNYFFQNQILDVPATTTNQAPVSQVVGNNFSGRLFVRKEYRRLWTQLEISGGRQLMSAPQDSSWQCGPRLGSGLRLARGSEITFNYFWSYGWYDTRTQVDRQGYAVPGTKLRSASQTADVLWHQVWDGASLWHTFLGVGYDLSQDNGSGYFNYSQYRLSARLEYRASTWSVSGGIGGGYYDYPVQTISQDSTELRHRTGFSANLHANKQLLKKLKIFADYTYDASISDLESDNYHCNTFSLGLDWRL